jgi:TetR/AcrR family transcriptional regulator, cholesterol catabolism regulator
MENIDRILETAELQFRQFGVRSISMDDIARKLGISKKTIYENFKDKDALAAATIRRAMDRISQETVRIKKESKDAVDEILQTLNYMDQLFSTMNPAMFHDLEKYHPEAWKVFNDCKADNIMVRLKDNLKRGQKEGLYRDELDLNIVATIRMAQQQMIFDSEYFPPHKFDLRTVNNQSLELYMFGITTLKGHRLINRYLNKKHHLINKYLKKHED